MKKYFYVLILVLLTQVSFGQQQSNFTEIIRFIIQDARFNKLDLTPTCINAGAYLNFYRLNGSDQVYFGNVWPKPKTQSYGRAYNIETTHNDATATEYGSETIIFNWSYINDYDKREGTASMKIGITYKPNGTTFLLTMIPETLDVIVYKGYIAGSLNLPE